METVSCFVMQYLVSFLVLPLTESSDGKERVRAGCSTLIVFLMSCDC